MHEITRLRQPLARFPITKQIYDVIRTRRTKARPELVSDSLAGESLSLSHPMVDAHALGIRQMILSSEYHPTSSETHR